VTDSTAADTAPTKRRVREYVTETLRVWLVTGVLRPGARYSAPGLAQELGVSSTPVKAAMLDFVRLGVVEPEPNAGFRVVAPTAAALDDLIETLLLLEVPTMTAIARDRSPSIAPLIEALRAPALAIEKAALEGDVDAFVTLSLDFHRRFLEVHGNPRLAKTATELRSVSQLYGLAQSDTSKPLETAREHIAMIDAALANDASTMERLVRGHFDHTRREWGPTSSS
jgi:DNA-binding GntR family transcriptional regulator